MLRNLNVDYVASANFRCTCNQSPGMPYMVRCHASVCLGESKCPGWHNSKMATFFLDRAQFCFGVEGKRESGKAFSFISNETCDEEIQVKYQRAFFYGLAYGAW